MYNYREVLNFLNKMKLQKDLVLLGDIQHPDSLYADFAKQMIEKEEQYQGDDRE